MKSFRDAGPIRAAIVSVRDGLLAEHLGTTRAAVAEAFAATGGSLVAIIDRLRRAGGRTLLDLTPKPLSALEKRLAERRLLDPERPYRLGRKLGRFVFR